MALLPTLTRRRALSPWRPLGEMEFDLDRWMRGGFPRFDVPEGLGWSPAVDLVDADGEFMLTAELPGVDPDDVEVDVEHDTLTIKGEKKEERKEETKNFRLYERGYGSFERSFTFPRSVDAESVKAEFENGVLTVHLPKRKEAMGRKIEIESGK